MEHEVAKRVNESITRPLEKKILLYFASKMHNSISPDHLTYLGLFGSLVILLGYFFSNFGYGFLWLASFGFFINWFGDSLDGTIARYRHIERPLYGFYIDHNVDAMTTFIIGVALGVSPFIRFDIAMYLIIGYFLLSVHTYIDSYLAGFFKISYGGIGPTEVRLMAVIGNTILFFVHKNPKIALFNSHITYFDLFAIIVGTALYIAFIVAYFKDKKVIEEKERENAS
ncbi:MAG: CDP-alcohol phosphatidyltransferase family protein [Candidatus Cloacimonetes bacterium]|nr:CDP-alcohol phosphatidyltransferase family protein [Candidatus Cloacimonadota bacterium]